MRSRKEQERVVVSNDPLWYKDAIVYRIARAGIP